MEDRVQDGTGYRKAELLQCLHEIIVEQAIQPTGEASTERIKMLNSIYNFLLSL